MAHFTRRAFLKTGLVGAATAAGTPFLGRYAPLFARPAKELVFRPYPTQTMPPISFVYAADEQEDPFKSSIGLTAEGIVVPKEFGSRKFSVNTRWYVQDFGYVWLAADNGGEYYTRDGVEGDHLLNLSLEFARSRVSRNARIRKRYELDGAVFSPEVVHLVGASEELLADAVKQKTSGERCARLADRALTNALWAGEKIELEKARRDIETKRRLDKVFFGCESRQLIWAKSEEFTKRFVELFNFATITHYVWDTWYELFEPKEGMYNWGIKDDIVNWLSQYNVTLQGRPLFWFHPSVTPEWLKNKSFDEVKTYVDRHTRDLVTHYGDRVLQWEIVNEYHDWANIHHFSPEQITEIVRRACDRTHEVNPKVVRIINNCGPFGEYVARGRQARMEARRPLRTPRQYLRDLAEAGVEYDVLGIQIYFPQRDLSDIARLLERLETFGKPMYITEIGASSNLLAPTTTGAVTGTPEEPHAWHRPWDEELQADWLEQVYTLYYSRPFIKAINWYDFSDFRPFIINGGLVREDCTAKQSFHRMKQLLASWNALPESH